MKDNMKRNRHIETETKRINKLMEMGKGEKEGDRGKKVGLETGNS